MLSRVKGLGRQVFDIKSKPTFHPSPSMQPSRPFRNLQSTCCVSAERPVIASLDTGVHSRSRPAERLTVHRMPRLFPLYARPREGTISQGLPSIMFNAHVRLMSSDRGQQVKCKDQEDASSNDSSKFYIIIDKIAVVLVLLFLFTCIVTFWIGIAKILSRW